MTITKEQFEQGMSYAAYKAQMTRNRERLEANEKTVELADEDLTFFNRLPAPLPALMLAEDWCGDVIANLPVLARLAEASGKIDLRIFLRDQNLDLMDQYLKDGQFRSIPVVVFFDADFNELGHWIERPARISELMTQMRHDLFTNDPLLASIAPDTPPGQMPEESRTRLMQAFGQFREEHRSLSDREVVRELRALIEHGIAQTATPVARAAPQAAQNNGTAAALSGGPVKVSITYCAACGYEPQTLALTGALMNEFLHDLASIEIIPWHDGAFDVVINGDLVHSMYRDGGFPAHETIIQAVRKQLVA